MTLNQIETFIAVAEAGGFTKAAQLKFISPQALMQQITALEKHLGFPLFLRNSKGVRLSPEGQEYYVGIKQLLCQYQSLIKKSAEAAYRTPVLRIGLPHNITPTFLISICNSFIKKYPDTNLGYEIIPRLETSVAILQDKADICAQIGLEENPLFYCEPLFPVHQYCIVSYDHPLSSQSSIEPKALSGSTVGFWETLDPYKKLINYTEDKHIDVQYRNLRGNIADALVFCMEGNIFIASIPLVNYFKDNMKIIPLGFDCNITYSLIYKKGNIDVIKNFVKVGREASKNETHPWKVFVKNYLWSDPYSTS